MNRFSSKLFIDWILDEALYSNSTIKKEQYPVKLVQNKEKILEKILGKNRMSFMNMFT